MECHQTIKADLETGLAQIDLAECELNDFIDYVLAAHFGRERFWLTDEQIATMVVSGECHE